MSRKKTAGSEGATPTTKKATTKKATAKKAAVKKKTTTTKKRAAKKAVAARTPAASTVSDRERYEMIATMAYYRAEQRAFTPGQEVDDWLECERLVDSMLGN